MYFQATTFEQLYLRSCSSRLALSPRYVTEKFTYLRQVILVIAAQTALSCKTQVKPATLSEEQPALLGMQKKALVPTSAANLHKPKRERFR